MKQLVRANVYFLGQAESLLDSLEGDQYCQKVPHFYNSTIGQHLRHCLDHYASLLDGLGNGKIDYDCREREIHLEASVETARERIGLFLARLESLNSGEAPVGVLVKMDCGGEDVGWQPSTLGRELQFLVSHTVHHFAMIGGMCASMGIELEKGFGVAPSSLRHEEAKAVSA